MKSRKEPKCILVSGRRNPDIDSVAEAGAGLRRRRNRIPAAALRSDLLPERAAFLFRGEQ